MNLAHHVSCGALGAEGLGSVDDFIVTLLHMLHDDLVARVNTDDIVRNRLLY